MSTINDETNNIIINIKDINYNKIIRKKYKSIDDLSSILIFLNKIENEIKTIELIRISFCAVNTRSNVIIINKHTKNIITSKFFIDYCNYHGNKILVYDEKLDIKRRFNIVISNDEQFKNADPHSCINIRDNYYEDRTFIANP